MAADTTGTVHKDSSIPSVQDYFDNLAGDMTRVTWAHAVNSQSKLSDALNDDEIMMLEADVILGRLIGGSNEIIPVMGHPPSIESDLSLQNFIESVIEVQGSQKKGIKLDFKSTDVFKGSLKIIDTLRDKLNFPVWLNSDILSGPINSDGTPVDADTFLQYSKTKFPDTTLSLGWTTKLGPSTTGAYTEEQFNSMEEAVITNNSIRQPVTLAVRAAIIAQSKAGVLKLVEQIDKSQKSNATTITIWMSTATDLVDVPKLRDLILTLSKSRVFLDVPEKLKEELNLESTNGGKTVVSAAQGVLVAFLTSTSALISNILKWFD